MAVIRRKGKPSPYEMLQEVTAKLGGLVIKRYKDKIVLALPPAKRKTKRKPTPLQDERRQNLKEAVFYARRVNNDPVQKAAWKKRAKGYSNVYQAVVSWYLKNGQDRSAFNKMFGSLTAKALGRKE